MYRTGGRFKRVSGIGGFAFHYALYLSDCIHTFPGTARFCYFVELLIMLVRLL